MTPALPPETAPALLARAGAVGLAVLVLLALAAPPPARAHGAGAGVRYELVEVAPEVDGLTVQVVRGLAAQLVVGNDTGEVVEVLDETGRPFLRVGPEGVQADVASSSWAASDRPFGLGGGDPAGDDAPPRWRQVGAEPSWGWYDHRLHEQEVVVPPEATGPVELAAWTVPLRVGDREVTVTGRTLGGPPSGFVSARLVTDRHPVDGLVVTLLPGQATGVLLEVADGQEALVRGEAGEPFLRFADGRVEVNAASPTWHRTGGGQAEATDVDATAPATWQPVAEGQRYGWIEPRASAPELEGDPAAGTVLATWAVPVEVDGEPVPILGELLWTRVPDADGGGTVPWLLQGGLAVAGLVAVAALVVVRRRSRSRDGAGRASTRAGRP